MSSVKDIVPGFIAIRAGLAGSVASSMAALSSKKFDTIIGPLEGAEETDGPFDGASLGREEGINDVLGDVEGLSLGRSEGIDDMLGEDEGAPDELGAEDGDGEISTHDPNPLHSPKPPLQLVPAGS